MKCYWSLKKSKGEDIVNDSMLNKIWSDMKSECIESNIDIQWEDKESFESWALTSNYNSSCIGLIRKNKSIGYSETNCKFVAEPEVVKMLGEKVSDFKKEIILKRISEGMSVEKALTMGKRLVQSVSNNIRSEKGGNVETKSLESREYDNEIRKLLAYLKSCCYNENYSGYKYFGKLGIKVCDSWREDADSFIQWCYDNEYREWKAVERIDKNGDFSPTNCRLVIKKSGKNKSLKYSDKVIKLNSLVNQMELLKDECELVANEMRKIDKSRNIEEIKTNIGAFDELVIKIKGNIDKL